MMVRVVPKGTLPRGIWAIRIGSELYDFVMGSEEAADCVMRKVGATGVTYIPCSKNKKIKKGGKYRDKYAAVLYLANSIKDPRSRALALAAIASEMAMAGNKKKSEQIFSKALEIAGSIKNEDRAKTWVLSDIAVQLRNAGKKEKSEAVISEAIEVAKSTEESKNKAYALMGVATGLAETGKIERALGIAASIKNEALKAIALSTIATTLARTGKIENALKIADSIAGKTWKAYALSNIATELATTEHDQESEKVFSEAIEIADSLKHENKTRAFSGIATALAKLGKVRRAVEMAFFLKYTDFYIGFPGLHNITTEIAKLKTKDKQEDAEIANSIMTAFNQ